MKFAISAFAFAASLAFVGAQDPGDIPQCAFMCLATANQEAGCQITDVQCQCTTGFDTILQSVMSCVPSQCSAEDTAKIAPAVEDICSRAGVTLTSLPTAAPTGTPSGVTDAITGTVTAASSDPSNTNAAGANIAGLGAVALGMAAVLAL